MPKYSGLDGVTIDLQPPMPLLRVFAPSCEPITAPDLDLNLHPPARARSVNRPIRSMAT